MSEPKDEPSSDGKLSTTQAAEILGVSAQAVRMYVARGDLTSRPGPGGMLIPRDEVQALKGRRERGEALSRPARQDSARSRVPPQVHPADEPLDEVVSRYAQAARRYVDAHARWQAAVEGEAQARRELAEAKAEHDRTRDRLDGVLRALGQELIRPVKGPRRRRSASEAGPGAAPELGQPAEGTEEDGAAAD